MNQDISAPKYMDPKVDFAFKKVFGTEQNKPILIDLLKSLLKIDIRSLVINNSELIKDSLDEKSPRLDVLATLGTGEIVDIEIQVSKKRFMDNRALFYGAKLISGQKRIGENYSKLVPVWVVIIADFIWDKDSPNLIQKFVLKNDESNKDLTPDNPLLAIYFVEFTKLKLHNEFPKSQLEHWLLFFKSPDEETMEKLKMSGEYLSRAVSELEYVQLSELDRMRYNSKIEKELERNTDLLNAKMDGHEEGKTEGLQSAHMKALERFRKQALKRFPALSPTTQHAIFMMNETQLDQQNEMIIDYPDQKAFEIELQKIAESHK